ncbi:hydroxyacid dehydrogenase [Candidatus Bipolaricaulota bacterium]|nr:hydroxyacid dehydrogenase [Candidatus Bipolaricaulota bacterium]
MDNKKFRILSLLNPIQEAVVYLEKYGSVVTGTSWSRRKVLEKINDFDAVLADDEFRYDAEFFSRADKLKVVSRVGVGYENVDVEAASDHGVMVTNTPGVMAESVAEHAIMLMLASANNLVSADSAIREDHWEWEKYRGVELWNGNLGQIGLGKIGYMVAKKAADCFNMRVLVHDPYAVEERVLEVGGKSVNLGAALGEADVVSINVPLTEETNQMIGKDEFKKMKESAILVNTSRGKVVDQSALVRALKEGEISKAGLDVLEEEPPEKDDPILELDQVIFTPHQASNTETGVTNMFMGAVRNLTSALQEKRPRFLLNPSIIDQG